MFTRTLTTQCSVLRHLQLFRVSNNCLSVLPREMGKMRGLTHLDLGGNRVGNLPYDMRCTLACACALARAFLLFTGVV